MDHLRVKVSPAWSIVEDLKSLRELEYFALKVSRRAEGLGQEEGEMRGESRVLESGINQTVLTREALQSYRFILTRALFGNPPRVVGELGGWCTVQSAS